MSKNSWNTEVVEQLYNLPFFELVNRAYMIHKENFDPEKMELCTLLSIKTGSCPEDCAYCPQSAHYNTGVKKEDLWEVEDVLRQARIAKENGAKRFCMGAAWRVPPKKEFSKCVAMIQEIKGLGLETCFTLGMLTLEQAVELKDAGLDFYNHNIDTSENYYKKIITTRKYQDRLDTLKNVSDADINVCCGGIIGMGETRQDRIDFLLQLSMLPTVPTNIPINKLSRFEGTPLANVVQIDNFEFIRTIAIARIMFPKSVVRLACGREKMPEEAQAWCFMAGANSIFYGEKLLTSPNSDRDFDLELISKLGMTK